MGALVQWDIQLVAGSSTNIARPARAIRRYMCDRQILAVPARTEVPLTAN